MDCSIEMRFQPEMSIRKQLSRKTRKLWYLNLIMIIILGVKNLERKELESRIKEITKNIGFAIMLAEKIVSKTEEEIVDSALGISVGWLLGSYSEGYFERNGHDLDKDEMADTIYVALNNLTVIKRSIQKGIKTEMNYGLGTSFPRSLEKWHLVYFFIFPNNSSGISAGLFATGTFALVKLDIFDWAEP